MTSEKMNQLMLQRYDLSTFLPYMPPSDSEIASPNQCHNGKSSHSKPASTVRGAQLSPLIHAASDDSMTSSPTDAVRNSTGSRFDRSFLILHFSPVVPLDPVGTGCLFGDASIPHRFTLISRPRLGRCCRLYRAFAVSSRAPQCTTARTTRSRMAAKIAAPISAAATT